MTLAMFSAAIFESASPVCAPHTVCSRSATCPTLLTWSGFTPSTDKNGKKVVLVSGFSVNTGRGRRIKSQIFACGNSAERRTPPFSFH